MEVSKRMVVFGTLIMLPILLMSMTSNVFSQLRKMSIKDLTQESTAIIHGKCGQKDSFWNDKQDKIFTRIKIQTDENIKGSLGSETEIIIPGGRVGNTIYEVSEMPAFQEGEEVVVFIWRHPTGINLVTGGHQGKLSVKKDQKTGEKTLRGGALKYEEGKGLRKQNSEGTFVRDRIFLHDFIKQVKGYVKE